MRVSVVWFGVLKDLVAAEWRSVELQEGETAIGLVRLLEQSASKESAVWRSLAVAINREYASHDTVLRDGDEVALLPPVSGGWGEGRP